jgi:hypothetical protein
MTLCMVSALLSGCFERNDADNTEYRRAYTITIMTIVEDSTTAEAIQLVEKELNTITEARFMTRVKLIALKQSEYEAELERRFGVYDFIVEQESLEVSRLASIKRSNDEKIRQDKAMGITQPTTKKTTEPTTTAEPYTEKIIWPKVSPDQIDIFLITSPKMFADLVEKERLQGMDDELGTKVKVMKEYIHPAVLAAGRPSGGRTFAIPTNKLIGEATYLAVNKELVEKYEIDLYPTPAFEYSHLVEFLEIVKENEPGVALIEGPLESLKHFEPLFPDMPYLPIASVILQAGTRVRPTVYTPNPSPTTVSPFDLDAPRPTTQTDENGSKLATVAPKAPPPEVTVTPASIGLVNKYDSHQFVTLHRLNNKCWENGLFETSPIPEGKERAAFFIKGTYADMLDNRAAEIRRNADGSPVLDENGNTIPIYEYILYNHPMATKEQLQSSMYGVSASSKTPVVRCMEILMLMNTNKYFKNTFQYGIEGTHYIYNEDGMIERLSNDYMINMDYTGNHFIADLMAGENPNKWELAKEHNLNVVMSVFMNFTVDYSRLTAEDEDAIPVLNELGEKFYKVLSSGLIPPLSELDEEFVKSLYTVDEDGNEVPPQEYGDNIYGFQDDYIFGYMRSVLYEAGWLSLFDGLKSQTNPTS